MKADGVVVLLFQDALWAILQEAAQMTRPWASTHAQSRKLSASASLVS